MKIYILACLLAGLFGTSYGQDSIPVKKHRLLQIGLLTTSVVTSALGDGLNSRTKYGSGHALSAASYLSLLAVPIFTHVGKRDAIRFVVSYTLIRYALFDGLYNVGAKRNINYIGGKNYYDESAGRMPLGVFNATKVASLGIVIFINSHK